MSTKALIVNTYQVNLDLCFLDFFVVIGGNHGFDNFDMGDTKIAMACNLSTKLALTWSFSVDLEENK